MSEACGPFVDGYIDNEFRLLPSEAETGVRYKDNDCLSARPKREQAREEIADYILAMLGAPTLRIELDVQQIAIAVDTALKKFETELISGVLISIDPSTSRARLLPL